MGTNKKKPEEKNAILPTGVSENGRSICIVSQLNGISEEDIRIDLDNEQLIISLAKPKSMAKRKISVPLGSRICKKKFSDGILEITLEKPE